MAQGNKSINLKANPPRLAADIVVCMEHRKYLSYHSYNEHSSNIHHGTTVVELKGDILEGAYYTGRGRMTYGSVKLTRARRS